MANLNELTNEQREAHRVAICKVLWLDSDPVLGNLDYAWMTQENGMKSLVLYARRGVTEQLREINGVDIRSLEQHDGPGYVSFKATAVNKKGRQEIAVGAHETEGLKGKRLADAIATAQTRALRRVTLQFVGYGVLDESEVSVQPITNVAPEASLAQLAGSAAVIPPPQTAPNSAPGRDITAQPEPAALTTINHDTGVVIHESESQEAFRERQAALRADAAAYLDARREQHSVAQNPPNEGVSLQGISSAEEPKKRTRRKRGQVDLASPGQTSVPPATAKELEQRANGNGTGQTSSLAEPVKISLPAPTFAGTSHEALTPPTPTIPAVKVEYQVPLPPHVGTTVVGIPAAPDPAVKVKQEEYRTRLKKYSNDVLPQAGMTPSEGIGGTTMKLRKFAALQIGAETSAFTDEQFEDLFEFLDGYIAKNGGAALVSYIDKALGVAK